MTDQKGASLAAPGAWVTLVLPDTPALVVPIIFAVPLQLLAYHLSWELMSTNRAISPSR